MAEKLCELKKKGGGGSMSETVLWTNPNPSSNQDNSAVTLSESIENYEKIRVYWKNNKTTSDEVHLDVDVSIFQTMLSTGPMIFSIGSVISGTGYYRPVNYNDDTHVKFGHSSRHGSTTTYDNTSICTKICGLK